MPCSASPAYLEFARCGTAAKVAWLDVDVAVIGGGPAGAATAVSLARTGVDVALVERTGSFAAKVGEALPPRARGVLADLGVWQRFVGGGHLRCYGNRSAWGTSRLRDYDFILDPHGCGWQVDRANFDAMLVGAAVEAGTRLLHGAKVVGWERSPSGWELTVRGEGRVGGVRAHFVVDASGRAAAFARGQGMSRERHDRLIGLVARLEIPADRDLDTFTLVETVHDGWWYSARLPGRELVAVYLTDADLISRTARTGAGWRGILNATQHTCARVEGCASRGNPYLVTASSAALDRVAGDSWLAVGDAAASYDPLSSEGIVTAMEGGQRAGQAICNWLRGDRGALAAYADRAEQMYRRYLAQRSAYYRVERRWPSSPFWHRRAGTSGSQVSRRHHPEQPR